MENVNQTEQTVDSAGASLATFEQEPLALAAQKTLIRWRTMIAENDFSELPSIIAAEAI